MPNPKAALKPSERISLEKLEKLELPSPSSPSSSTPENGTTIPIPKATSTAPPKLDRTISWIGAVGLAFTISNSWMSYAATFGPSLVYGGGVTVLFALIIAAAAQWVVLLGVCEMASAIPSSGVRTDLLVLGLYARGQGSCYGRWMYLRRVMMIRAATTSHTSSHQRGRATLPHLRLG
jgi:hypothetical protein